MKKTVAILGGGVGGMSAAQELAERNGHGVDYEIRVYEKQPTIPGGKARSLPVPNTGTDGRPDLPGEHGFRFIPGFYKHLPDSMSRIPVPGGKFASDNMVDTTQLLIGRFSHAPVVSISRFPRTVKGFKTLIHEFFDFGNTGLTKDDLEFFAHKLWQIITSCYERRLAEYERISWWDFVEAGSRSVAYQNFLASGLARSLTANNPHTGNSMTLGDIYVQLLLGMTEIGGASDKVLNAPTNVAWIDPWLDYLRSMNVQYTFGAVIQSIECDGKTITGVNLKYDDGREEKIVADYYISAVPVEVMADLVNADMLKADPALEGIIKLKPDVAWMNGLMYYLNQDVPIVNGHQLYVDSPWAITGISQIQFWDKGEFDVAKHGNGQVRGILSTDISNWDAPGILYGKAAKECTDTEIKDEVWAQITNSLNVDGKTVLSPDMIVTWYLDPDIRYIKQGMEDHRSIHTNSEPLLIHKVDTWVYRPQAHTGIPNLFLASDYVQTNTDLACMEGANEAARRAVNSILSDSGSTAGDCKIWPLHEPAIFAPWRVHDKHRFEKGLPWNGKLGGGCIGL